MNEPPQPRGARPSAVDTSVSAGGVLPVVQKMSPRSAPRHRRAAPAPSALRNLRQSVPPAVSCLCAQKDPRQPRGARSSGSLASPRPVGGVVAGGVLDRRAKEARHPLGSGTASSSACAVTPSLDGGVALVAGDVFPRRRMNEPPQPRGARPSADDTSVSAGGVLPRRPKNEPTLRTAILLCPPEGFASSWGSSVAVAPSCPALRLSVLRQFFCTLVAAS